MAVGCYRAIYGGTARLGGPTEVLDLVEVDRVGPSVERSRSMGTEARGVVIPERRDELKERNLRIRECGWSRCPNTRAVAGRVALELWIVAVISDARREHRICSGLADHDAIGDRFRTRRNAG